ncbi:MAG: alpha/beta fold hydrolase, partial [Planctomycetia bacterium]
AALAAAGYDVLFLERRGSGRNEKQRGHCWSFLRLLRDVEELLRRLKEENPGRPVGLAGISWGGKLAVGVTARNPQLVDAAAFLCPGWVAQVAPTFREKMEVAATCVFVPYKQIRLPLQDPNLFTDNPAWREYIEKDPASLRKVTSRLIYSSLILDLWLTFQTKRVTPPALLVLAGKDKIVANEACKKFFWKFASEDKTLIEYPAACHTLEFEQDPTFFFDDLRGWFDARLSKKTAEA